MAESAKDVGMEVLGSLLLFFLVFGMSATVDIKSMQKQVQNKYAILTGVFLQFILLPFLGFAVVRALNMSHAMGLTLLVVTSSPGEYFGALLGIDSESYKYVAVSLNCSQPCSSYLQYTLYLSRPLSKADPIPTGGAVCSMLILPLVLP